MWPLCHLSFKFSSPEALLDLVVESGHLGVGWVTTAKKPTRHEVRGQRSASGPGVGWEA